MMSVLFPNVQEVEIELFGRRPSGFAASYRFAFPARGPQGAPRGEWALPRPFVVSTDLLWPLEEAKPPLTLKHPIDIETSVTEAGALWRLPEFDLVVESTDDEHAEAALLEQLVLLKDAYVDEPADKLTPAAQELKRRLVETLG
jgi:hypothetical protein